MNEIHYDNSSIASQELCELSSLHDNTASMLLRYSNLPARFSSLLPNSSITIAETKFGTGVNFLATCLLWVKQFKDKQNTSLHYIAIENSPLNPEDIAITIENLPELKSFAEELIKQYYLLLPGFHRLKFGQNIYLTLIIGDIESILPSLEYKIDIWFLSDLKQNNNEKLWTKLFIPEITRLSHHNSTFVALVENIEIEHLLQIQFKTQTHAINNSNYLICGTLSVNCILKNNLSNKTYYLRQIQHKPKSIAIIGAGISGAATAFSLATRGYMVTVFEQNNLTASEASGNYQGMLYGSWSAFGGEMMELSSSAYRYSHNLIKQLLTTSNDEFAECGIIQLAHSPQQSKRNQQLLNAPFAHQFINAVNKSEIQKLANCTLATNIDGVFFPHGLWLHPPALVNALLTQKNITLRNNCKITNLKPNGTRWQVYHDDTAESFDTVVLCNSHMLNQFEISQNLPIRKIRGQISISETNSNLTSILCGDGYITPNKGNKFTFGATFDFKNENCDITERDHQENIDNFNNIIPTIMDNINIKELSGNTNLRASPHDYMPIVGQLANREYFMSTYAKISKDKNAYIKSVCDYIPNLYLNIGHGSKGMLTAPFCGEIIADYIDGTVLPISQKLRYALHPNRFYIRELVKSKK